MLKVGIVIGSDSDLPVIKKATDMLTELEIPYEIHIYSAHRTPEKAAAFSRGAPIVTRPFSEERSCGSLSWVLASISSEDGEPVRNVILYFST